MANDKCSDENLIKYRLLLEKIQKEQQALVLLAREREQEKKLQREKAFQEILQREEQEKREREFARLQAIEAAEANLMWMEKNYEKIWRWLEVQNSRLY